MSTTHTQGNRPLKRNDGVTHSRERALDEIEYERLYVGACRIDDPYYRLQTQFVVTVLGRLGLRKSELVHMSEDWIDWRNKMVCIPSHDPCTKGEDGGLCGSCRQKARQRVEHATESMTIEEAKSSYWRPKTAAAHRKVYFGHDPRVEMFVNDFFDEWDTWYLSGSAVDRRLNRAANNTDAIDASELSAHPLRATAATWMSDRRMDTIGLKQHFGWSDIRVARKYVEASPQATAQKLDATRSL